jgi:hypothetical protein
MSVEVAAANRCLCGAFPAQQKQNVRDDAILSQTGRMSAGRGKAPAFMSWSTITAGGSQ